MTRSTARLMEESRVRFPHAIRDDGAAVSAGGVMIAHVSIDYLGEGEYPADVEAGRALARQLVQAQAQDAAWRADVAAAGQEIVRLRATGRTHPACAAERRALDTAGL